MSDWLSDKSALSGGCAQPRQPTAREPIDPQLAEEYRDRMRLALEGTTPTQETDGVAAPAD